MCSCRFSQIAEIPAALVADRLITHADTRRRSVDAFLSDVHDFAAPSSVVAFYLLLLDQPDAFYASSTTGGIWHALARQRLNMPPELVERVRTARGQLRADRSAMRTCFLSS